MRGVRQFACAWLVVVSAAPSQAAVDPRSDILVVAPEAQLARLCREAGFTPVAEPADGAAFADEAALRAFTARAGPDALVLLPPGRIHWRAEPALAVLREGRWPGMRRAMDPAHRDVALAAASREPWVDANSWLVAWLQAVEPGRPAVLAYRPPEGSVPYESVELALVDAYAAGGNVLLRVPEDYQRALAAGDDRALAAWRSLGETAAFLKSHADWFRQPGAAKVAVLTGTLEQSGEILNMMFRRNVSPRVLAADALPAIDPARFHVLVAANIDRPQGPAVKRMLGYARAGGLLVTAPAWPLDPAARKERSDEDRDHYSLGKGKLIAYRAPIEDPNEFALDILDAVGARDFRLWNAGSVIGLMRRLPGGRPALMLINYGRPRREEFPARVDGVFRTATLHEPGAAPRGLKAVKRGAMTEVAVERLKRFAVIVFE